MGEAMGSRKHEPSKRQLRSRARAQSHATLLAQETSRGRLLFALGRWKRATARPSPPLPQPPPPPPPLPPPTDECIMQQRQEHMTERVEKRAPPSPAIGASPSDARAKRALVLHPAGQPPPSLPPSPPSSTSSTPAKTVSSPASPRSAEPPSPPSTSTTSSPTKAAGTVSPRKLVLCDMCSAPECHIICGERGLCASCFQFVADHHYSDSSDED